MRELIFLLHHVLRSTAVRYGNTREAPLVYGGKTLKESLHLHVDRPFRTVNLEGKFIYQEFCSIAAP